MADEITSPAGGPLRPPAPITAAHDLVQFSCAEESLNDWLKRRALRNEGNTSRTYVVAQGNRVVGYYTLAAGSVMRAALPRAMRHDTPEQIPVVILARLATDRRFERRGVGAGMLQEAITRLLTASVEIGVRALIVHALDDAAAEFYRRFGFVSSPIDERTLVLPVETARRALVEE